MNDSNIYTIRIVFVIAIIVIFSLIMYLAYVDGKSKEYEPVIVRQSVQRCLISNGTVNHDFENDLQGYWINSTCIEEFI